MDDYSPNEPAHDPAHDPAPEQAAEPTPNLAIEHLLEFSSNRKRANSDSHPSDLQLENKITTLCAMLAATEYQFLSLLAEYDQRRAWAGEGTRSCAHWLNWRYGIKLGAAREKVRVAHALTSLPKISEAFSKGHLSYSKVRAMTRIATPELEDSLMVTAQYGSASHIEKLVRIYRRCETREELDKERKASNQRHYTRFLTHYWDEDGSLIIKAALPPEQGAIVLKALEAATEALREDDQFDPSQGTEGGNSTKNVSSETRFQQEKQSGERRVARKTDALTLIARDWLNSGHAASKNADRYQVVVNIGADILAHKVRPKQVKPDRAVKNKQSEQVCSIDDMHSLPVDTVRRISCDCSVLGVITRDQQPLSISRKTRSIPPSIRRALVRRDHGCTFPGCSATEYVEGHHLVHWANGGETSLDNLALLCSHHHQLMHEGDYTVNRNTAGRLEFFDPRGRYIDPRQAQPDDIDYRYLVHRLQAHGIDECSLWSYSADRMDYDYAIDGLISQRDKAQRQREQLQV